METSAQRPGSAEAVSTISSSRWPVLFLVLLGSVLAACRPSAVAPDVAAGADRIVIAIDVGHTAANGGATSARGRKEFYFNLDLARLLQSAFLEHGFENAFLINEDGADISLAARTAAAREKNADFFISIHHDSLQPQYLSSWEYQGEQHLYSDRFQGHSIFYSEENSEPRISFLIARLLGRELRKSGFRPTLHHAEPIEGENRELVDRENGVYRFDELVVLKTAESPAILLECGVILNRDEEILLRNPVYQRSLVLAIVRAFRGALQEGLLVPRQG